MPLVAAKTKKNPPRRVSVIGGGRERRGIRGGVLREIGRSNGPDQSSGGGGGTLVTAGLPDGCRSSRPSSWRAFSWYFSAEVWTLLSSTTNGVRATSANVGRTPNSLISGRTSSRP